MSQSHESFAANPNEAPATNSQQFSIHTVIIAMRCWWKVAFPIGLLLAIATGSTIYFTHSLVYTSEAFLQIKEKPDFILRDIQTDSKKFIQNQKEILRSKRLLGPLASNPKIISSPELVNSTDIPLTIAKRLVIRQHGQSEFYTLSYSSESASKAKLIMEEIVKAYLDFNRQVDSEQDNRIINLLEDQRLARYEEMNQLRENVRKLSVQLTGIDPFRTNEMREQEQNQNIMGGLQSQIIRAEVDLGMLAAQLKLAESDSVNADFNVSETELEMRVNAQPIYQEMIEKLAELKRREADIVNKSKNLESNQRLKDLQTEIKLTQKTIESMKDDIRTGIVESLRNRELVDRDGKIEAIKSEYTTKQTQLEVLRTKFEEGMRTSKQFTGDSLDLEFRRAKLEQVSRIHDEIQARILAIKTEQRAPERVESYNDASLPSEPDELLPWKKIGLGGGVAFLIPFALAIAWEHFFRRVSSRNQIESEQMIRVIGEVAALPPRITSKKRSRSQDREFLLFEESVESVRTYLSLVEPVREMRVLSVTSAVSGEGKTSLAAQLAVSIARSTKKPTLLIDGDLRAPDMHTLFRLELSPGLSEVLRKEVRVEEAIDTSYSETLHVLTAGKLTSSPHRLLNSGDFSKLLEKLRGLYRYIVVDTPPILPASEALVLARASDAAVLCIRRDHSRLSQSQEAYQRMQTAGVKVAGAVLNGIPVNHYAYKYGDYAYQTSHHENAAVDVEISKD